MGGAVPPHLLRIIDANTNRLAEGLRFLEEIARMTLNDAAITEQLKHLRHELTTGDFQFQQQLIQSRNAEEDVGANIEVAGANSRELSEALVANSRRAQESLRVLEELAKTPGTPLSAPRLQRARFALYTLEKNLLSKLLRKDKLEKMRGLYVVIDIPFLGGRDYLKAAGEAVRGGAKVVQLRDKVHSKKELLPVARALKELCAGLGVPFIVNDHLDLALAVDADGLHVGQDDLPAAVARKLLPIDKLLGVSVFTVEEAIGARDEGADYLGVGSIFATSSKDIRVVGVERLREIRQATDIPLVAIGGINKDNVAGLRAAGADSFAVISAVLGAEDIAAAVREIAGRFEA